MEDRELFEEVLKNLTNTYKLTIEHPYDDDYIEIYRNGKEIGGFNPSGFNLLYNLKRLCKLFEDECYMI